MILFVSRGKVSRKVYPPGIGENIFRHHNLYYLLLCVFDDVEGSDAIAHSYKLRDVPLRRTETKQPINSITSVFFSFLPF